MPHVVSVFNHKGGVGKTTMTANLAAELARRGKRVLVVDADPQASLTMTFVWPELWRTHMVEPRRTIAELLMGEVPHAAKVGDVLITPEGVAEALESVGARGTLDLVASNTALREADLEFADLLSATTNRQKAQKHASVFLRLARALEGTDHDVVLIDCPPAFSVITRMALVASRHVLVPTRPDYLSTSGVEGMLSGVTAAVESFNSTVATGRWPLAEPVSTSILAVLFTMVSTHGGQPIKAQRQYIDDVRGLGHPTFDTYVTAQNTHYTENVDTGVPIVLSPYARHEETVGRLRAVATEFLARIGEGE